MFTTTICDERAADLTADLDPVATVQLGNVVVVIGQHLELGSTIIVADAWSTSAIITQNPLTEAQFQPVMPFRLIKGGKTG